ncbi:hypothetical protein ACFFJX_04180 [Pseudarcicella hirudinis]|uniref:hypothetical protein n=1 Tax=Pseudarcicella hirudinis TaxID=1079859 RepID=UPI0035E5A0D3
MALVKPPTPAEAFLPISVSPVPEVRLVLPSAINFPDSPPTSVLSLPFMDNPADPPNAVLYNPVVLSLKDEAPIAVL